MDVGASTGGFTDCMLQNGAVKVFSVDVGHGQLAWKLRNDPRVVCMEKTNIRYVTPGWISASRLDFSFDRRFPFYFPLTEGFLGPDQRQILSPGGEVVALIKPQFEAGREKVGKKGVVREKSTHLEVIQMVMAYAAEIGFEIRNLEFSPIKGPEGNIEYLLYLHKPEQASEETVTGEEALAKAEKECPVSPEQVVEGSSHGVRQNMRNFYLIVNPRKAARRGGRRSDLQLFLQSRAAAAFAWTVTTGFDGMLG